MNEPVQLDLRDQPGLDAMRLRQELHLAGKSSTCPSAPGVVALVGAAVRHWQSASQASVTRWVATGRSVIGAAGVSS